MQESEREREREQEREREGPSLDPPSEGGSSEGPCWWPKENFQNQDDTKRTVSGTVAMVKTPRT